MGRVVVSVQKPLNGPSQVTLLEPSDHQFADTPAVLPTGDPKTIQAILDKINATPLSPDAIRAVGMDLIALLSTHPAIKDVVLPLLDQKNQTPGPVYLLLRDPDLEQLPWEALWSPNLGFISCDQRFSVARAQKVDLASPEAVFVPPLKIMAILGASGADALTRLSAADEWAALYGPLKSTKLNIRMKVLVCEEDLKTAIDAEKQDWIETGLLATEDEQQRDLFQIIRDFSPHMLHFFCHGAATPFPRLEVGTQLDWEREQAGSIQIEGMQLRQKADPNKNIWLITLNCCESAMNGETGGSRSLPMASSLVTAGFPAVVGMRERVESDLAHLLCHEFYDTLFGDLTQRIKAIEKVDAGAVKEIHWACALYSARQRICRTLDKDEKRTFTESAGNLKEWTIPVLFTRLQPFGLRLVSSPGSPPVFRPDPAAQPPAAGPKPGLTQKEIHDLADEMEQLLADREKFMKLKPVVARIDKRLAEIENELNA
jgi:hypothetical protein